jgi:hypothetical protein
MATSASSLVRDEYSNRRRKGRTVPTLTKQVEDNVASVNDEIAVGFDLDFQEKWWRFERILWMLFAGLVLAGLAGAFGRGFLSKATVEAPDGSIKVEYERIARYSAPSILTVQFGPATVREGQVQLWLGDAVVRSMGAQRVVPQPVSSSLTEGGLIAKFPALSAPSSVEFALEPAKPGLHELTLRAIGSPEVRFTVAVLP